MEIVISITKPVTDQLQAQQLFDLVKQKLSEYPDIRISGMVRDILLMEQ